MKNKNLPEIFKRYLKGTASPDEVRLLLRHFDQPGDRATLSAAIRAQLESGEEVPESIRAQWDPVLQDAYTTIKARIQEGKTSSEPVSFFLRRGRGMGAWKYVAAAVAVVLVCAAGLLYIRRQPIPRHAVAHQPVVRDIAPGSTQKAMLILANGKQIALDSVKTGMVSRQGNIRIIKQSTGKLAYSGSTANESAVYYNTILTPRGGQYQVELSDGTQVWLNDASSLYFPNQFTDRTREVQITGEAYFEVAENAAQPFSVHVNGMTIEVLGTHFNVMAYGDESIAKVTLLEGAIKVAGKNKPVLLKPGEQAQFDPDGKLIGLEPVDLQGTIAWTKNQFWFDNDSITTVMRQLARWYDVDIVVKGNIPQHFDGYLSRNIYVSKVFEALQATSHLQYEIREDTIIVSPQKKPL